MTKFTGNIGYDLIGMAVIIGLVFLGWVIVHGISHLMAAGY